jgi:hypothetical protein
LTGVNHSPEQGGKEKTMAQVQAKVAGGSIRELNADTVEELRDMMGLDNEYQATVNGEPQDSSYELEDYEFVSFSKKVKAGL